MNDNDLFRQMLMEFMLHRIDELESDRVEIINRISIYRLSSDDYYALLINDIRQDYAVDTFRRIRQLMDCFLK